ncbi:hypothetical protein NWP17_12175 [Chrysosporum bergii ANA360D]|uniref:Uncharacterized protein n=1 Tax=Chrysosporum bergii ANA360D TaxID=617107 RepID=A0AA43GTQ0_9CYAN|nr:hypothetical protein [Chrysosporum bergii]MDH6061186.1 hypothetical protein [Chrysosporum bergii ANA360D]
MAQDHPNFKTTRALIALLLYHILRMSTLYQSTYKQVGESSAKDGLKMHILPPPLCLSSVLG